MASGLYDLVREYADATPERKNEIEVERQERFPFVQGWPQYPDMIYCQVAQNVWGWGMQTMNDMPYVDENSRIVK